ncbi:MAG: TlpA family protein disulfide reductase, partial [Planctomycetaceae bacterium]|nr:TlpA family protein disulfide reductase [Planctomycetaceae bacterium]
MTDTPRSRLPMIVFAIVVVGLLAWMRAQRNASPSNGAAAPALAGPTLDGGRLDLADLRGKTVLVDFWATWCGPCLRESPRLVKLYAEYKDRGFEIVGVVGDDPGSAAKVRSTLELLDMTWPQLYDDASGSHDLFSAWGVRLMPTMILVGPDGTIISRDARSDLEGLLE